MKVKFEFTADIELNENCLEDEKDIIIQDVCDNLVYDIDTESIQANIRNVEFNEWDEE